MNPSERKSSLFVRRDSGTSAEFNRQGRSSEEFDAYADAYRRAAQTLFREHFTPKTKIDLDALPIAFMYRHAAELYLKGIARLGNSLLAASGEPRVTVRKTHRLTLLIDDVRPIFDLLGLPWTEGFNGQRSLAEVRDTLGELERDEALGIDDTQGDMWRYPVRSTSEQSHLPFQFSFDVAEFVNRLDPLLEVLAGVGHELADQLWHLRALMLGLDHFYNDGYLFCDIPNAEE
jgi:hypothetical protein